MPIQTFKLKDKKSPSFKDKILKVSPKIPSADTVKSKTIKATKKAAEITKDGLKDGVKKSATKIAGIGVGSATAAAIGGIVLTGGAVTAAVTAGIPIVAGTVTTCILDRAVKAVIDDDNNDDNHIDLD